MVERDGLAGAPTIVATESERVIVGAGNIAYVEGLDAAQSNVWQVYRPGSKLIDPETQEILGYEAIYLGDARVQRSGEPATVNIFRSTQEINAGDKLVVASEAVYPTYVHSPDKQIKGRIISVRVAYRNRAKRHSHYITAAPEMSGSRSCTGVPPAE